MLTSEPYSVTERRDITYICKYFWVRGYVFQVPKFKKNHSKCQEFTNIFIINYILIRTKLQNGQRVVKVD